MFTILSLLWLTSLEEGGQAGSPVAGGLAHILLLASPIRAEVVFRTDPCAALRHVATYTPIGFIKGRESENVMHTEEPAYATDCLLRDGGSIHVRAIQPSDKHLLCTLFNQLSERSVYFRFFQTKTRLTDAELRYFTELDFDRQVGLVATSEEAGEEQIVAVGRYFRLDDSVELPRAEVAFAVADAHQGRGLGTLLLDHLAAIARERGIEVFEADVLGENNRMLQVFASSGFKVERSLAGGVFHVSFPTADTEHYRTAHAEREHQATAESLRAVLHPHSVAIVGASQHPGGLPAFPTVSAIGEPVDLAIIAVPAAAVEATIADCAEAGVRGVVVISTWPSMPFSSRQVSFAPKPWKNSLMSRRYFRPNRCPRAPVSGW